MYGMVSRPQDHVGQAKGIKRSAEQCAASLCLQAWGEAADNEEGVSSHMAELVQPGVKVQPEGARVIPKAAAGTLLRCGCRRGNYTCNKRHHCIDLVFVSTYLGDKIHINGE